MIDTRDLTIRPATMDDAKPLYDWRTDAETMQASHTTTAFPFSDHMAWLGRTLKDSSRTLLVAELDGELVGTVRVDRRDDFSELSWTVAPSHRGRGIGQRMVLAVAETTPAPLYAEVKEGNAASIRIAAAAGFHEVGRANGIIHYRKSADARG
jgi:RimJ/RimL family protein N-acetyltransferase